MFYFIIKEEFSRVAHATLSLTDFITKARKLLKDMQILIKQKK